MEFNAWAAREAGGKLEPFAFDPGELADDEVEIEVESCGICHSDLSMLGNDWGMSEYPFVPGHEVIGKVARVGERVGSVEEGQRVGLGWHSRYCLSCSSCLSGDHNLCPDQVGTIIGRHGGFADRVRAQATSVIPIPEGVDPQKAGPLLCGGITVFNPLVQFNISPTAKVAVIGIGGLGHLALQFLRAWGCHVTAFTSSDDKREEAKRLGAHDTLDSTDDEAIESAAGRFDLVMNTVNAPLNWQAFLGTLAPKGRFHCVGAVPEPIEVQAMTLISGQVDVSGSPVGSPVTLTKMLEFCARHGIEPVTETYPFDQVNEAFEHLEEGKARYRVVLVN